MLKKIDYIVRNVSFTNFPFKENKIHVKALAILGLLGITLGAYYLYRKIAASLNTDNNNLPVTPSHQSNKDNLSAQNPPHEQPSSESSGHPDASPTKNIEIVEPFNLDKLKELIQSHIPESQALKSSPPSDFYDSFLSCVVAKSMVISKPQLEKAVSDSDLKDKSSVETMAQTLSAYYHVSLKLMIATWDKTEGYLYREETYPQGKKFSTVITIAWYNDQFEAVLDKPKLKGE